MLLLLAMLLSEMAIRSTNRTIGQTSQIFYTVCGYGLTLYVSGKAILKWMCVQGGLWQAGIDMTSLIAQFYANICVSTLFTFIELIVNLGIIIRWPQMTCILK